MEAPPKKSRETFGKRVVMCAPARRRAREHLCLDRKDNAGLCRRERVDIGKEIRAFSAGKRER